MKRVPLTQGKVALVDDEDYERVMALKWQARYNKVSKIWYAKRCLPKTESGIRPNQSMHAFILGVQFVDHADRDGLNNQRHNLRPCTRTQNGANRKLQKHSAPYKGVHCLKQTGKFQGHINADGKRIYLGTFETAELAARAYDIHAIKLHGKFARTNQQMGVL